MEIASKYNPSQVEDKWYEYWLKHRLFHSEPDARTPFTVVIPPPNVTGVLHMGHMLNNTIQDILVRRARMMGMNACWVPGTDHASIATEAKVVNKLAAEGVKKSDLTREQFLKHAWDWTHEHGGIILEQLKKLGASCDWERTAFTMDKKRSESVYKAFVKLYEEGLIYRGVRMVNWDPKALTALSDEEVVYKEEHSKLYYLRYYIEGEDNRYIVVATTRPETILGDTAVCINPEDERYKDLLGKRVIVPIVNRSVPIISDVYVDVEFGTGCLKVTPAHDINDYMLGEKHHLPSIDIFNDNGTLNEYGLHYAGMDRFEVREQIEKELRDANLVEKIEPYNNKVGFSERTDVPIEPKLSMQWFLKMDELAKPALEAVMSDAIKLFPPKFKNTYRHWLENIKDWCISRQLWWGHRIPAYYLPEGGVVVALSLEEAVEKAREKTGNNNIMAKDLRQESDCLDTWFSSWLWPITIFGAIDDEDNKELAYYYPTSDLVTAPDILFFWVARMIMAGYHFRGQMPFKNVYFTGIVRDSLGRKMSKSLGNSPEPLELIKQFGADGVRMGLMMAAPAGNDVLFDEALCEQGRNFNNKIWNAFRLIKGWEVDEQAEQPETSRIAVEWFDALLKKTVDEVDALFDKYRLSEAMMAIYKLFWDEFSAWYLELIKPEYGKPIDGITVRETLRFFDSLLRLLHPFMPFITEELWQALAVRKEGESIMLQKMPRGGACRSELIERIEFAKQVIAGIRTIRLQKNIPNRELLTLCVLGDRSKLLETIVIKAAGIDRIQNVNEKNFQAISFMVGTEEFAVPVDAHINVEEELDRLQKELDYQEDFLIKIKAKLSNRNFVAKAPEKIIEIERKKQADAEQKITTLRESMEHLKK